ncbi:hypothetical protein ElyMa_002576100 [Elysia marginata]|uniref:Uncharacterized protein n=1 Tax=Elysia marginata TaxID=1093978 RepID=A0AAV4GYG6_9GAST|nr:hypothetical protein ElyMa_002576100 [Elysia marginata]
MFKIIGVLSSMVLTVQPPLQVIPQMFDWIKVRRKCWPWQNLDVALLKKLLSVSDRVISCVLFIEKQYFYVWRCKATREPEAHLARMFAHLLSFYCGKNWPNPIIVRDSTQHHQRCSNPPVVFPNAICLVSFTASSPYTFTAISMVNAESRFVTEYDTSPLDAISRGMFLGP